MKKNLLFIIPNLTAGGGEKSLITLLSQIDYNLFNVDLFMLRHDGLFMPYVPKEVQLLTVPQTYKWFALPLAVSIWKLLLKGKFSLLYYRLIFTWINRLSHSKNSTFREQNNWKYVAKSLDKLPKRYDVAIGFLEKTSNYFCVDKVEAAKKIGWVHIDYEKLGMDSDFDRSYFEKLDHIVTVSEECANVLRKKFPSQQQKVEVIYNIVSPKLINKLANEINSDVCDAKGNDVKILSIGRLHYQKGYELAIKTCKQLIDKGYNIKWNVIGDGPEREKLNELIQLNNLNNHFQLLGLKSNPYPYLKQADIYVQTSRFEGKSIAIDEAKILSKPIVVTDFSTVKDQISHGVDGLIVGMNAEAIASGIEQLILDANLRQKLIQNLSQQNLGTEHEIDKVYSLIG